ncbi:MAG: hypothetical protein ACTHOM_08925 [Allomuricauda sp.]
MGWLIIIVLFLGLPILGYFLFTGLFDAFFGKSNNDPYPPSKPTKIIDKSVHHHYHDNRQIHVDGEKFESLVDKDKNTQNDA